MNLLDAHAPEDAPRNPLRGGFAYTVDPQGGLLIYSPAGACFAWVGAIEEVEARVAQEEVERLWT